MVFDDGGLKCPCYQRLHETREEEYLCIRNPKSADCENGDDTLQRIRECKLLKFVSFENYTLLRKEFGEIICLS